MHASGEHDEDDVTHQARTREACHAILAEDVILFVIVFVTVIVAALVSGNDAVGVADAVNAALVTHGASGWRRATSACTDRCTASSERTAVNGTTVDGVAQVHESVPVPERGHGHGLDHASVNGHGYVHGF